MPDVAIASHVSDFDPFAVEAVRDPQTYDALLREQAPAVYLERYDIWATGRHEHVYEAARDWEAFSSTSRPFHDPNSIRPEILLTDDPPQHPRVRAVIQRALSPAVIRRMREFLRRGRPQVSTFDIAEMLQDAVALARPEASSRGIALVVSPIDPLPLAHGDRVQLQQVVLNLVKNAMESLTAANTEQGEISIAVTRTPRGVDIAVTDNGPGITPELATTLFEPLTTSKHEGLGLGLPICQTIVESHGGRIWLESGEAGQTQFRFSLPLDVAHEQQ